MFEPSYEETQLDEVCVARASHIRDEQPRHLKKYSSLPMVPVETFIFPSDYETLCSYADLTWNGVPQRPKCQPAFRKQPTSPARV